MQIQTKGFIPTNPIPPNEGKIISGDFWPVIELADFRSTMRTDGTITTDRLRHAVIDAVASVNGDLALWSQYQMAAGYPSLMSVPAESINQESVLVHRYRRAVYAMARGNLYERYLDSSATGDAVKDTEARDTTAADMYRDARFAIRDILGTGHLTVELI
ncbi:head completion/stabilization protein [Aeromonas aquatica]|uniref:head completion/stabilization protein n=1 Tax=Aeromonas aquatica TaxID=558964 RepID=UPI00286F8E1F|nr:head completion/stabilization protein [Aeromonas aquatica]